MMGFELQLGLWWRWSNATPSMLWEGRCSTFASSGVIEAIERSTTLSKDLCAARAANGLTAEGRPEKLATWKSPIS